MASHTHSALDSDRICSLLVEFYLFFHCQSALEHFGGGKKTYDSQTFWDRERLAKTKLLIKSLMFMRYEDFFWDLSPQGDGRKKITFESVLWSTFCLPHVRLYRKGSDIKGIDWLRVDFYLKQLFFSQWVIKLWQERKVDHNKVIHLVGLSLSCWGYMLISYKTGRQKRGDWGYEKGLGEWAFLRHSLCFRWFNVCEVI